MRIREINAVVKKVRRGMVRAAVLYPSFYHVAADSLAVQMLYHYLNSQDDVYAERFVVGEDGEPVPLSLETRTPLTSFEVILVSVHYELDLVNILRFLLSAGVPLRSSERESPIVVAGGPPVIANPLPLAEYVDVLVVGEIEEALPQLLEAYRAHRGDKKMFLEELNPRRGFYVPVLFEGDEYVDFAFAKTLPLEFHPVAQFQPLDEPGWERRTAVETSRGCFRGCAFCLEGRIFNVARERPVDDILNIAREGRKANLSNHLKFVSLSFFDHSKADEILERALEEGLSFSIPSLRAETLNEDRLELMRRGGQKTLTIAPETGSRDVALRIGKYVSVERASEVASAAKKAGFTGLKLYLMVGLPWEDEGSLEETARYVERLSEESGFKGERELKITVSPFVPKPHTPLQGEAFVGIHEAKKRISFLRKRLGGKADVRVYDPRLAAVQTVIARGDALVGKALAEWAALGGRLGSWRRAMASIGLDVERYLGRIEPPYPWSFIRLPPRPLRLKAP